MANIETGLSVIVPCYNEVGAVGEVLTRLVATLAELDVPWEVIAVDDGSTDGTAEALAKLECRLVRHATNRGYGAAIRSGVGVARYDLLAITDADGTYPNEKLPGFYTRLREDESLAMIVGARTTAGAQIPLVRRPAKWAIGQLANYLTGVRIPDTNSGLRVFRRELYERFSRFYPDGFSFTTTITLAALTNGYHVHYEPIDYFHRVGSSKIRPIRDTIGFTQLILRTVMYFNPLKVFVPASLALFVLSLIVGVGSLLLAKLAGVGQFMDVTTVVLFVSAIQMLAIGALADLITKRLG